tara:strand:+ start:412 stop:648 length:237 start_codon:yes stop_codon:yes gene_type:complete
MVKVLFSLGFTAVALIKGDIHNSTTYFSNAILGIIFGFTPIMIEMTSFTETIKLISSLIALLLVSLSTYRAWKHKDNE